MRPLSAGEVRRMKLARNSDNKIVPLTARVRAEVSSRSKSSAAA
jgi:hypothetical protein